MALTDALAAATQQADALAESLRNLGIPVTGGRGFKLLTGVSVPQAAGATLVTLYALDEQDRTWTMNASGVPGQKPAWKLLAEPPAKQ